MGEKRIRIKKVQITEEFNELGFIFTGPMYTTLWVKKINAKEFLTVGKLLGLKFTEVKTSFKEPLYIPEILKALEVNIMNVANFHLPIFEEETKLGQ